jgi:dTDP-glucose pyrophosphorylase
VSEYLVERLVLGGADKICFVISPGKSDILEYYGGEVFSAHVIYAVQPAPAGLCDAIFRPLPLIAPDEDVLIGLPDTIWFPQDALAALPAGAFSFLLFPVEHPELFDAVLLDDEDRVREIQVKVPQPSSHWIWGAFKMSGATLRELHALWVERQQVDEYVGTLVNAWIAAGGVAHGVRAGRSYVDVGTIRGYREAIRLLTVDDAEDVPAPAVTRTPEDV